MKVINKVKEFKEFLLSLGHKRPIIENNNGGDTYKIVRFYPYGKQIIVKTGLTFEQAKKHCDSDKSHYANKYDFNDCWFDMMEKEKPNKKQQRSK